MNKTAKRKYTQPVCPFCGSKNVARYLYGLVTFTAELEEKLNRGKIVLGGCIINEGVSPKYQCNDCEKDFGLY